MLQMALKTATRFRVFPIWPALPATHNGCFVCGCGSLKCKSPAKHPIGPLAPRGVLEATQDAKKIEWWWNARPDANLAIALGDGVIVIDVDPRNGGARSLADLQNKFGELPITLTAHTGGAGKHLFFEAEGIANSTGVLGPGLDVKSDGGYVVASPSRHISGNHYSWDHSTAAIARLPDDLLAELIGKAKSRSRAIPPEAWRELVINGVDEGARDVTLARLAGHLLRRFIDPYVVFELMHGWNATRCRPPLPHGDVARIVDSIAKREIRRRSNG